MLSHLVAAAATLLSISVLLQSLFLFWVFPTRNLPERWENETALTYRLIPDRREHRLRCTVRSGVHLETGWELCDRSIAPCREEYHYEFIFDGGPASCPAGWWIGRFRYICWYIINSLAVLKLKVKIEKLYTRSTIGSGYALLCDAAMMTQECAAVTWPGRKICATVSPYNFAMGVASRRSCVLSTRSRELPFRSNQEGKFRWCIKVCHEGLDTRFHGLGCCMFVLFIRMVCDRVFAVLDIVSNVYCTRAVMQENRLGWRSRVPSCDRSDAYSFDVLKHHLQPAEAY